MESLKRKGRYTDMRRPLVRILRQVVRDFQRGLPEDFRILQILASQKMALGIPHYCAIAGVNDDPPAVDVNLRDDVFCVVFRRQQEQAPSLQTGAARKI